MIFFVDSFRFYPNTKAFWLYIYDKFLVLFREYLITRSYLFKGVNGQDFVRPYFFFRTSEWFFGQTDRQNQNVHVCVRVRWHLYICSIMWSISLHGCFRCSKDLISRVHSVTFMNIWSPNITQNLNFQISNKFQTNRSSLILK